MLKNVLKLTKEEKFFLTGYITAGCACLIPLWIDWIISEIRYKRRVSFSFPLPLDILKADHDYANKLIKELYSQYNISLEYPKVIVSDDHMDILAFYGSARNKKDYEKFLADFDLVEYKKSETDIPVLFGKSTGV